MAVKIRHEAGERMTGKAAAFIKLVEIGEKTAGIVLRHAGKGILCGDENGVAQKAEQERVPAVLNDASAAIENLSAGREDADGDICQPSEGIAVSRFRKAAGGWKAEGFIRLQPDGAPFWQMAEEGDILRKIFGFRAVEFHAHLRHETDRVIFQHFPGDIALFVDIDPFVADIVDQRVLILSGDRILQKRLVGGGVLTKRVASALLFDSQNILHRAAFDHHRRVGLDEYRIDHRRIGRQRIRLLHRSKHPAAIYIATKNQLPEGNQTDEDEEDIFYFF